MPRYRESCGCLAELGVGDDDTVYEDGVITFCKFHKSAAAADPQKSYGEKYLLYHVANAGIPLEDLSDKEKSVLLARAQKWSVYQHAKGWPIYIHPADDKYPFPVEDLYARQNFHLAWQVHRWMCRRESVNDPTQRFTKSLPYIDWFIRYAWFEDDAQRLILDKILALLIEDEKT